MTKIINNPLILKDTQEDPVTVFLLTRDSKGLVKYSNITSLISQLGSDFIPQSEKGVNVATLIGGKLDPTQVPDLAITSVQTVAENTLTAFVANNAAYTYEEGDVLIINDGSGNLTHYMFDGGDKFNEQSYSLINATEIEISQVNGLQLELDGKLTPTGDGSQLTGVAKPNIDNDFSTSQTFNEDVDIKSSSLNSFPFRISSNSNPTEASYEIGYSGDDTFVNHRVQYANNYYDVFKIDRSNRDVDFKKSVKIRGDLNVLNGVSGAKIKLSASNTSWWKIERDPATGNFTVEDDGVGKVLDISQNTGNASFSNLVSSSVTNAQIDAASGDVLVPKKWVQANTGGLPYKVYSAIITQTGTNAPTSNVLQNTLGVVPVWTRGSAGDYRIDYASGSFTGAVMVFFNLSEGSQDDTRVKIFAFGADYTNISSYTSYTSNTLSDNLISKGFLEIRVYD